MKISPLCLYGATVLIALSGVMASALSFAELASFPCGKDGTGAASPEEASILELSSATVMKAQMASTHKDMPGGGVISSKDTYSLSATIQLPDGFNLSAIDSNTELNIVFGDYYTFSRTLGEAVKFKIYTPVKGGYATFVSKSGNAITEVVTVRWDSRKVLNVSVTGTPVNNSNFNIVVLNSSPDGKVIGQAGYAFGFGNADTGVYFINYGGSKNTRKGLVSWNVTGRNSNKPVTIKKMYNYYDVTLDYANTSHREMGRQFALSINKAMPDYEATIDFMIALHILMLKISPEPASFSDVLSRAQILFDNPSFNHDYKDEIEGMQDVFNYDVDMLGDGRLSKNELLIYQMFSEVVRPTSCSASAVTGDASATGKTIIGRNWDWMSIARYGIAHLHAITTFKNGNKTITNIGTLGTLNGLTLFNQHNVFGAIINATTGVPYPADLATRRSFFFDLRYAFENFSTLDEISDYMKDSNKLYVYNHLILLADPMTAGVVENQVNEIEGGTPGNRSFRVDSSELNPAITEDHPEQGWGILGVFAAVNDFRLPNNYWTNDVVDTTRWISFKNKYAGVSSGWRIDIETLKTITGYPGPRNDGVMSHGAIFNSEMQYLLDPNVPLAASKGLHVAYTTMQSVILDLDTMELWVHFVPPTYPLEKPPLRPTYRKITNLTTAGH